MLEIRRQEIQSGLSTQAAYDDLYAQTDLAQLDSFYLWLLALLNPSPGRTLLDISCGQGRLAELAAQRDVRVVGTDFSFTGLLYGKSRIPAARWVASDGEKLPFADHSFDYVTHIGSLEHYEHPRDGAREIARMLAPAGRACVLLPNAYGFFGNVLYVARHGEIFDDGQPLQRYGTLGTWRALLMHAGLTVEQIVPYGEVSRPRTARDWAWLAVRPHKIVRAAVQRTLPIAWANHFVFLCRLSSAAAGEAAYPTLVRL